MKKKNKTLRVILQLIFLIGTAGFVVYVIVDRSSPARQSPEEWSQKEGFLALSYGALSRKTDSPNMHRALFRQHLDTLREAGYETITTANLVDFYRNGSPLPDKAVYLMFEGGRRDSAIYGQEALSEHGMRATMFIHSGLVSSWNRTILTQSQLHYLGKNDFWEVGLSGREVYLPNTGAGVRQQFYLSDYIRDENGKQAESAIHFYRRAREDYRRGIEDLEMLSASRPEAYIFWPANSLGGSSMDSEVSAINRRLIAEFFPLAFTREGPGYNHRSANPLELSRIRVSADCSSAELLRIMAAWLPVRTPYRYGGASDEPRWRREIGTTAFEPDFMELSGDEGRAMAWLIGSEGWRNSECSFSVNTRTGSSASIYLRYVSRDEFVRVQIRDNVLRIQERLPDHGLITVFSRNLPEESIPAFTVRLVNNRLRLLMDGAPATSNAFAISQSHAGRLAVEANGKSGDKFRAAFSGLTAIPLPESWTIIDASTSLEGTITGGGVGTTGVMVALDRDYPPEKLAETLLRTAGEGLERFALLPPGELSLPHKMTPASAVLPGGFIDMLWNGVVFVPEGQSGFGDLANTAAAARASGLKTVVLANAEYAILLSSVSTSLPIDVVIIASPGVLPPDADTRLRRRYAVLYARDGARFEERIEE